MKPHAEIATERLERAARLARVVTKRKSTAERIHDLRGSCRRAVAVLDAYRLDTCDAARARKLLRKFLKRAGRSRDATVAIELLRRAGAERALTPAQVRPLIREQRDIRDRADARIRAMDKSAKELRPLLAKLAKQARRAEPLDANTALGGPLRRVRSRVPRSLTSLDALHKLRLALKRVRFAAELCGPTSAPIAEHAHRLTDRLGAVQDLRVLSEWLSDRAREQRPPKGRRDLEAAAAFSAWALPQRTKALKALRSDVNQLLRKAPPRAGVKRRSSGPHANLRSRTTKRLKQKPSSPGNSHRRM